jgi:hypothetical protein
MFEKRLTIAEDAVFCLDAFRYAHKVVFFNMYLTHYRIYGTSTIRKFHSEAIKINEQTIQSYYDRVEQHLDVDEDYQNVFLGMVCDSLFRVLKNNILHKKNKKSIFKKVQEINTLLNNSVCDSTFIFGNIKYLPNGKKDLAYCAKKKWSWGVYFVGLLSVWHVQIKRLK